MMSVTLPRSGNSWSVKEPSRPVVVHSWGISFTLITVPMSGSPVLLSFTIPSSVWAFIAITEAMSAALIMILFIYFVFLISCIIFPSLSIIERRSCFLSTVITENPSAGLQNWVPSTAFTGRARDAEVLTT